MSTYGAIAVFLSMLVYWLGLLFFWKKSGWRYTREDAVVTNVISAIMLLSLLALWA